MAQKYTSVYVSRNQKYTREIKIKLKLVISHILYDSPPDMMLCPVQCNDADHALTLLVFKKQAVAVLVDPNGGMFASGDFTDLIKAVCKDLNVMLITPDKVTPFGGPQSQQCIFGDPGCCTGV